MAIETWLVSRELTELAGAWDNRLMRDNDGEYFTRVLCASDGVHFIPEARSYVRRASFDSVSSEFSVSVRKLESLLLSISVQIGHLRALEDSERTRAAGVKLLQNYLVYFYPEYASLVEKAQQLACDLGGKLEPPHLKRKHLFLQKAFGRKLAKRVRLHAAKLKSISIANWDKLLLQVGVD